MQSILSSRFVQGMVKATSDMWLKGWDERNGGNVTMRLLPEEVAPFKQDFVADPRCIELSRPAPGPANDWFIVTGSGKFFATFSLIRRTVWRCCRWMKRASLIKFTGADERRRADLGAGLALSVAQRAQTADQRRGSGNHALPRHQLYGAELCGGAGLGALYPAAVGRQYRVPGGVSRRRRHRARMVPGTDEIGDATAQQMQSHSLVMWPSTASSAPGRRWMRPSA